MFAEKTASLVGSVLEQVTYADINIFDDEPVWDHGEWHRAIMGVGLVLNDGPACVRWTDTFFPYGVEVFRDPLSEHLSEVAESWDVTEHGLWAGRIGYAITGVDAFWDRVELEPEHGGDDWSTHADLPIALRLDFAAGPVWVVAAAVDPTSPEEVIIPSDELIVAFTRERMIEMGFPDDDFLN